MSFVFMSINIRFVIVEKRFLNRSITSSIRFLKISHLIRQSTDFFANSALIKNFQIWILLRKWNFEKFKVFKNLFFEKDTRRNHQNEVKRFRFITQLPSWMAKFSTAAEIEVLLPRYDLIYILQNKGHHLISFSEAAKLFLDGKAVSHLWNLGKSVHLKKLAKISIHNPEL